MATKQTNFQRVLNAAISAILVAQALDPKAPGKQKKADVRAKAVAAAVTPLLPKEARALDPFIDAGVAAFKLAGAFSKDKAPAK
jgi:hypothetical protein